MIIYVQAPVSTIVQPINYQLLKDVYNSLVTQDNTIFHGYRHILLFIVSDDDIYDTFQFQNNYKLSNGKTDRTTNDILPVINVKQYVGKILPTN